jgi:uncharacterized protein YaeQ
MRLQCLIQDGSIQWMNDEQTVQVELDTLKLAAPTR